MPDTPNPLNVLLIVGSTRPGRTSDLVQPWLTGQWNKVVPEADVYVLNPSDPLFLRFRAYLTENQ